MSDTVQLMLVAACNRETHATLAAALERFDVACVLIVAPGWQATLPGSDGDEDGDGDEGAHDTRPALDQAVCQQLVTLSQSHDAAALIANDVATALGVGADGCHLDTTPSLEDDYRAARTTLGSAAIVGVMPGLTRHLAMALADAGADYVGYPLGDDPDDKPSSDKPSNNQAPNDQNANDQDTNDQAPNDQGARLLDWWVEIFESPAVAFTNGSIEMCERAIKAGPPEFLAVPVRGDHAIQNLCQIERLIELHGQLPVANKDAK